MTSTGSGDPDPDLADYYPAWLDHLADDVTLEGSTMDGYVQGAEAVRTVLVHIRSLYDYQDFHAVGPLRRQRLVRGLHRRCPRRADQATITIVTRNAAGQTQHIVGNYRPRSTLLLLSRLIGEKLADTPIAEHFLAGDS